MTPEKIVEKILPEKKELTFGMGESTKEREKGGYFNGFPRGVKNELIASYHDGFIKGAINTHNLINQRLLDTYGKEWVGVPDKWWLKDIITDAWYDQLGSGINRGQSAELIAESILKGLKGEKP